MTATITAVRDALKTRLQSIPGLTVYATTPGTINVPAAIVTPSQGLFLTYRTSFDSHDLTLNVTVFVQRGQDRASTEGLDGYISDSGDLSVFAAVAADPTLGGVVDACSIVDVHNWSVYTFGQISYLGAVFTAEVLL